MNKELYRKIVMAVTAGTIALGTAAPVQASSESPFTPYGDSPCVARTVLATDARYVTATRQILPALQMSPVSICVPENEWKPIDKRKLRDYLLEKNGETPSDTKERIDLCAPNQTAAIDVVTTIQHMEADPKNVNAAAEGRDIFSELNFIVHVGENDPTAALGDRLNEMRFTVAENVKYVALGCMSQLYR